MVRRVLTKSRQDSADRKSPAILQPLVDLDRSLVKPLLVLFDRWSNCSRPLVTAGRTVFGLF